MTCSVLSPQNRRCGRQAEYRTHYHGDPESHSFTGDYHDHVAWVRVYVCKRHARALGLKEMPEHFTKLRNRSAVEAIHG